MARSEFSANAQLAMAARERREARERMEARPAVKPEDWGKFEGYVTDGGTEHGYARYSNVVLG